MFLSDLFKSAHIEVDKDRFSGKPVLKNTRFPVAQLLAEVLAISEDKIKKVCDDFDLNEEDAKAALREMGSLYDQYWTKDKRIIKEGRHSSEKLDNLIELVRRS